MRNLILKEDSLTNRISYYHVLLFLIALPFDRFYSQLILISYLLHSIIHLNKNVIRNVISKKVLMLVSVYLLGVVAILYSPDKGQALQDAEKQLAILLFPVIFAVTELDLRKYKLQLLTLFAVTCTVVTLYLFIHALRIMAYHDLPVASLFTSIFMNHNFSSAIDIHATYLSMYLAMALITFLYLFIREKSYSVRILYGLGIVILSAGLLQLASRSVLIALLPILNILVPLLLYQGKKRIYVFLVTLFLCIMVFLCIYHVGPFKMRYVVELKNDITQASINNELLEPRVKRWKAALELVESSPVAGYGSGSEAGVLKNKYFEKKLYNSYLNELNAHNQYISFLIKGGIFGLVVYLFGLLLGFYHALKSRDIFFLTFLILVMVVSISENILDVNKGIFFYSFFFSFFLIAERTETAFAVPLKKQMFNGTGN